mmetsp:Transcript_26790/g.37718  ORF Transcript_26790/g.37718 Transcript_26790/m.37718 type:complete len:101 (-) Transcript_26790:1276-1578(-)
MTKDSEQLQEGLLCWIVSLPKFLKVWETRDCFIASMVAVTMTVAVAVTMAVPMAFIGAIFLIFLFFIIFFFIMLIQELPRVPRIFKFLPTFYTKLHLLVC